MADPMVPENRRFCASCGEPVGRGRDGQPGRPEGFCRKCGAPVLVRARSWRRASSWRGQYEVVGCLAHGGLGLGLPRPGPQRLRPLGRAQGLLNTGDEDAMAAALAERRFLAEVEHPNIVKIFNFVEHEGSGYIVMEYVGGTSLKQILTARRDANGGEPDPLPAARRSPTCSRSCPALGHLHELGPAVLRLQARQRHPDRSTR